MKKTKEQLELLVVMQKHKIEELKVLATIVAMAQIKLGIAEYNLNTLHLFRDKIGRAKMKLNHYKQLLANLKANKSEFKVGNTVRIVGCPFFTNITNYIGLIGEVRVVTAVGNYKVRTEMDREGNDAACGILYSFPPEALELIP